MPVHKCPKCVPHEFQDARYGLNMRVFTTKPKPEKKSHCTVCGAVREEKVLTKK